MHFKIVDAHEVC